MPLKLRFDNAKELFSRMNRAVPHYTLIVQGRFHAFALAKALHGLNMPVNLLTNYPSFMAERFGVPAGTVKGCGSLGLLHRYVYRWNVAQRCPSIVHLLHQQFSKWSATQLSKNPTEVVHVFSGVAKELYDALDKSGDKAVRLLARGSAHIREQYRDLHREKLRSGNPDIELPDPWMIRREIEEYRRSDRIVTLSSYARDSFLTRGYSKDKVMMMPLGSNVKQFRPEREIVDRRIERMRSGKKLTVLYTGNVSLQKGVIDLIDTARACAGRLHFQVVGNIVPDAAERVAAASDVIEFIPRVPESELPGIYASADLYMFPTLHDGYAAVLAQARAGCLPIIATDHCAAPDMITNGENGWIIPTRRADLMTEKLLQLDENREQAVQMVENLWTKSDTRDWADVGRDFILLAAKALQARSLGRLDSAMQ